MALTSGASDHRGGPELLPLEHDPRTITVVGVDEVPIGRQREEVAL